ncbi:MAG: PEP-CTERM sorting domain-containing protein [Candidatus Acidiferrales bacterium]
MKVLAVFVLLFAAISPAKADTTQPTFDLFNIANGSIIFVLPSTVTISEINYPFYEIDNIASVFTSLEFGTQFINFNMLLLPLGGQYPSGTFGDFDSEPFHLFCDQAPISTYQICAPETDIEFSYSTDPFTFSSGQLTFVPGEYGELTITALSVTAPEPGILLLFGVSVVATLLFRSRRLIR